MRWRWHGGLAEGLAAYLGRFGREPALTYSRDGNSDTQADKNVPAGCYDFLLDMADRINVGIDPPEPIPVE